MISQVLNFLWLGLDFPAPSSDKDGPVIDSMSEKYITNVRTAAQTAAKQQPNARIDLWVDSKRLTKKQLKRLGEKIESGLSNCHLRDLRSIPEYDQEKLYNQSETNPGWRCQTSKTSTIWRQVDAAKILISLQGDCDQIFFADLDHSGLNISSDEVQNMLKKHGMMIGNQSFKTIKVENQVWGFERATKLAFFQDYYAETLKAASQGENGYYVLTDKLNAWEKEGEGRRVRDILLLIDGDGSEAEHADHKFGTRKIGRRYKEIGFLAFSKKFSEKSEKKSSNTAASVPVAGAADLISSLRPQQTPALGK